MDLGFLCHVLIRFIWNAGRTRVRPPPVPYTPDLSAHEDLGEATSVDVADLDEASVEEEDIGCMEGDSLRISFPLDDPDVATRISLLVNIQPKLL